MLSMARTFSGRARRSRGDEGRRRHAAHVVRGAHAERLLLRLVHARRHGGALLAKKTVGVAHDGRRLS